MDPLGYSKYSRSTMFSSLLPPSKNVINTTDISLFLQDPSVQLGTILKNQLNYPDHWNLCLEGYNGKADSDNMTSNIITAATNNGTSLNIEINDQYAARPN